jgi:hypothetical protein
MRLWGVKLTTHLKLVPSTGIFLPLMVLCYYKYLIIITIVGRMGEKVRIGWRNLHEYFHTCSLYQILLSLNKICLC